MSVHLCVLSDRNESGILHLATQEEVEFWKRECGSARVAGKVTDGVVGLCLDDVCAGRTQKDARCDGEVQLPPELAAWLESVGQEGANKINALLNVIDQYERRSARQTEIQGLEERLKYLRGLSRD